MHRSCHGLNHSDHRCQRKSTMASIHWLIFTKGGTSTVPGILTFFKRLAGHSFQSLQHRFVAWTKPDTTSLLQGMLTDLSRSKSELVAENALPRQQLIILRRQVKRPVCTKTDRMLLVLLARIEGRWMLSGTEVSGCKSKDIHLLLTS